MGMTMRAICPTCLDANGRPMVFSDTSDAEQHLEANKTHYLVGRGLIWED